MYFDMLQYRSSKHFTKIHKLTIQPLQFAICLYLIHFLGSRYVSYRFRLISYSRGSLFGYLVSTSTIAQHFEASIPSAFRKHVVATFNKQNEIILFIHVKLR